MLIEQHNPVRSCRKRQTMKHEVSFMTIDHGALTVAGESPAW